MKTKLAFSSDMLEVYKLTHNQYVAQNYCDSQPDGFLIHYPYLDNIPETSVIIIVDNNTIVGTNSLTIDGPQKLCVDEDFPIETEKVRQRCLKDNKKLAAAWRIITKTQVRHNITIILELIKQTIHLAQKQNIDEWLFSLHPKHERIYHKLLGLDTIAKSTCSSVGNMPAVLMGIDSDRIWQHWKQTCKKRRIDP